MTSYELKFARINLLRTDIAEVIVHNDIELNAEMVELLHEFLIAHLTSPFSLLINKLNSYTYDFGAQQTLGCIKNINLIAVVAYKRSTIITTRYLASQPREIEWNLQLFSSREAALHWLEINQDACSTAA